jgi:hypothetical protein
MGKRALKILIGKYVNWYEDYADGISGKDFGTGIIIDSRIQKGFNSPDYTMYKVYRTKHRDFYWFMKDELDMNK